MPNHPTPEEKRRFPFLGQDSWDQMNKDERRQQKGRPTSDQRASRKGEKNR